MATMCRVDKRKIEIWSFSLFSYWKLSTRIRKVGVLFNCCSLKNFVPFTMDCACFIYCDQSIFLHQCNWKFITTSLTLFTSWPFTSFTCHYICFFLYRNYIYITHMGIYICMYISGLVGSLDTHSNFLI